MQHFSPAKFHVLWTSYRFVHKVLRESMLMVLELECTFVIRRCFFSPGLHNIKVQFKYTLECIESVRILLIYLKNYVD